MLENRHPIYSEEYEEKIRVLNNHIFKLVTEKDSLKQQLKALVYSARNNTGHEPSLSCFYRDLDEAEKLLQKEV